MEFHSVTKACVGRLHDGFWERQGYKWGVTLPGYTTVQRFEDWDTAIWFADRHMRGGGF